MDLTTNNYKSILSSDLIGKSQRCLVRECDELHPGHFESYVDELDQSFDVSLVLDKSAVISHKCDCNGSVAFCQHKTALLLSISKGKSPASKIIRSKKVDPLLQAIELADPEALRDWVLKVVKKHKDIGISFLHEFSSRPSDYTPEEITTLTQDSVKAVLNKRMKADATEVKKIVELWSDIHRGVLERYRAEPTNESYFLQLHAIIEVCDLYQQRLNTNSKRIASYITQLMEEVSSVISTTRDDETWKKSLSYFVGEIFLPEYGFRRQYFDLIIPLFNSSTIERRIEIVGLMVNLYEAKKSAGVHDRNDFLKFLLRLVIANNQFPDYKHLFSPIRHALSYNLQLIDILVVNGDLQSAETYCLEQIDENTRDEYDSGYFSRLKDIYKINADEQKLAGILKRLLLQRPDFMDYQFVAAYHAGDADFNKWRSRVLANARAMAYYDPRAAEFSLALMESEGNYKGLIDYLDERIGYQAISPYARELLLRLPECFLEKMISRIDSQQDRDLYEYEPAKLDHLLEDLYQLLLKKYPAEHLILMIIQRKKIYRNWSNIFVKYLSERLAVD